MPIRIDDPSHVLAQNEGKTVGAHVLIALETPEHAYHQAQSISQDANGRNLVVTIPFGVPVNLLAYSSYFQLSDATGSPLSSIGGTITVTAATSGSPTVHFVVTGVSR